LLDTALSLPPGERESWLEELPPEHESLRHLLRDLLGREDVLKLRGFLATLPKLTTDAAPMEIGAATGEVIGPYRLLRELGVGGMGSVWLAERMDGALKRNVALKLPHVGGTRASLAERMARERDILAALEHPHIARLYDAGVASDGRPYLALEYVQGEPIDGFCERHALDIDARLRLVLQVARAVAYAHAHLIVHRDLKPSNIQVDAEGQVHLLDFGIAKLLDTGAGAGAVPESQLTRLTGRALTPEYASPEQIRGESVSTASDVYSLGVVLYELLTGARPYRTKPGSGPLSLTDAILSAEPARPSEAAPRASRHCRRARR